MRCPPASLCFVLLLPAVFVSLPSRAASFTVTSTLDEEDANTADGICDSDPSIPVRCTLRAAIQQANESAGWDIIMLAEGTYTLTRAGSGEDSARDGDLDIHADVTIFGAGADVTTIQSSLGESIFHIIPSVSDPYPVRIEGVTMSGGGGAGVYGGAIHNPYYGDVTILNCEMSNGSAARGGGLFNNGDMRVANSTISANFADYSGGGISNLGHLVMGNSTISGNDTDGNGGGLYNEVGIDNGVGQTELWNVTIVDNHGITSAGGLYVSTGSIELKNSIVANNTSGDAWANCNHLGGGVVTSLGYNNIGWNCAFTPAKTDWIGANPLLGPLADNGGTTMTHLPLAGSVLIDRGDPSGCLTEALRSVINDQRGEIRPADGDGSSGPRCDIGAVEVVPEPSIALLQGVALLCVGAIARGRKR